jgi:hypothetical protein
MESDTVWIYVDTNHRIDHPDHLKVFADQDAAHAWFAELDREGVAFESCDRDAQSNTAIRARAAGIIGTTDRARGGIISCGDGPVTTISATSDHLPPAMV